MNRQIVSFLCILYLLMLPACRAAPGAITVTSPTAALIPGATVTLVPIEPPTIESTEITAVTAEAPAMAVPTSGATPVPTIDATSTAIVQRLVTTAQPRLLKAFPSPDGGWRAEVLNYPCTKITPGEEWENAFDILRIARLSDAQVFTARTQLQSCGGLGGYGLGGILWSPDSRYFYFTDAREGVPDGGTYGWYRNVFRFDTTTTQADYLGGGPFSPDQKALAVVRFQLEGGCHPGGLTVMDISGQVLADYPFDIPAENCGQSFVSWSPDGGALAYTLSICNSSGADCRSTLYRVDFAGGKAERKVLLEDQPTQFVNIDWSKPERIELWNMDSHWFYILASGELQRQP